MKTYFSGSRHILIYWFWGGTLFPLSIFFLLSPLTIEPTDRKKRHENERASCIRKRWDVVRKRNSTTTEMVWMCVRVVSEYKRNVFDLWQHVLATRPTTVGARIWRREKKNENGSALRWEIRDVLNATRFRNEKSNFNSRLISFLFLSSREFTINRKLCIY